VSEPVAGQPQAIWDRFPATQRLCINYTLHCNLTCDHCNVESSPHRKERLDVSQVRTVLAVGARAGKRHVTFSGGEVFLYYRDLVACVAAASELGYEVDVETNAFWARTQPEAVRRLQPVARAGLSGICLSTDAYHARYYPTMRSVNAARAARSLDLLVEMNFCPSPDQELDAHVIGVLEEAGEPYIRNQLLNRGRGRSLIGLTTLHGVDELRDCDSLTMTVHATGDVFVCCELEADNAALRRTPVFLGRLRREGEGFSEQVAGEALVHAFYDPGSPVYFRRMLAQDPSFAELRRRRYRSICDFCVSALSSPERVATLHRALERERER